MDTLQIGKAISGFSGIKQMIVNMAATETGINRSITSQVFVSGWEGSFDKNLWRTSHAPIRNHRRRNSV